MKAQHLLQLLLQEVMKVRVEAIVNQMTLILNQAIIVVLTQSQVTEEARIAHTLLQKAVHQVVRIPNQVTVEVQAVLIQHRKVRQVVPTLLQKAVVQAVLHLPQVEVVEAAAKGIQDKLCKKTGWKTRG